MSVFKVVAKPAAQSGSKHQAIFPNFVSYKRWKPVMFCINPEYVIQYIGASDEIQNCRRLSPID